MSFISDKGQKKGEFADQKRNERQQREQQRNTEKASLVLQRTFRCFAARRTALRQLVAEWDQRQAALASWASQPQQVVTEGFPSIALALSHHLAAFHFLFSPLSKPLPQRGRDPAPPARLGQLAKVILASWASLKAEENLSVLVLNNKHSGTLLPSLSRLLWLCVKEEEEKELRGRAKKTGAPEDGPLIGPELRLLVTLQEPRNWGLLWKTNNAQVRAAVVASACKLRTALLDRGLYLALEKPLMARIQVLQHPKTDPSLAKSLSLWLAAVLTIVVYPIEVSPGDLPAPAPGPDGDRVLTLFTLHILSVPLLLNHCGPAALELLKKNNLFQRCVRGTSQDKQSLRIIFNMLEGNRALFLLGNLTALARKAKESEWPEESLQVSQRALPPWAMDFVNTATRILVHCQQYVTKKASNLVNFHPIFNWYSGSVDPALHALFPGLIGQLEYLWDPAFLRFIFSTVLFLKEAEPAPRVVGKGKEAEKPKLVSEAENLFHSLRKAFTVKLQTNAANSPSVANEHVLASLNIRDICDLYLSLSQTLAAQRNEILNRVSFLPSLVPLFWKFMSSLGPKGNMDIFIAAASRPDDEPLISLLKFFFEAGYHLLLILDQEEMYEKQTPFSLDDLAQLARFLNVFVYRMTWDFFSKPQILESAKRLLMVLYDRDSARSFTPEGFWIVNEVSGKSFEKMVLAGPSKNLKDEEERQRSLRVLECLPHCVPFRTRLNIFQSTLEVDRKKYRDPENPVYVTIRRKYLVEDGFSQLAGLSPTDFRKIIKVKFVNDLGLPEAGIDQAGVFKEFFEDTIKAVFNPSFGLFLSTPTQQLYPSPSSDIHGNHLALFTYIGKLLGKAVYERIALDVPFALFFLSKFFGAGQHIDQLPSLDETLYKNLMFTKKYQGNFEDLALTFTVDEVKFGKAAQVDLRPGGSAIPVTSENVILYVYLVADYKLNRETSKQCKAFISGFKSVLSLGSPDQLSVLGLQLFSPTEIQKLISGDEVDLDLEDLKRHTNYEGGYHAAHKLIRNLWEVLADFNKEEKKAFLKYVTSCSKPPVGGFSSMEPPFTIRCVQENDPAGQGDRPLSVLTSFLGIGDDIDRLPTASTCFNLLKLPAYKKKSTLVSKLKYAINSGAGFELS